MTLTIHLYFVSFQPQYIDTLMWIYKFRRKRTKQTSEVTNVIKRERERERER